MSDNDSTGINLDEIAGEYVLGVLSDAERVAFEDRIARDADARAALARVRERFLELDVTAAPLPPSQALWQRIERTIEALRPTVAGDGAADIVDLSDRRGKRQTSSPAMATPTRRGFWQGFAAASVLAFVAGGVGTYRLLQQRPRMIVVLLDANAQPISIVETFEGQRIRIVPLVDISPPPGKALQVWTLPNRDMGPVSMGLMPGPTVTTLVGPDLPTPVPEQLYEITIEQEGGSPTGKPTGPIVGKGFAKLPQI
ncbi:MAG: anti-sigma factor domain-containing protein [Hyphomicrobiaceae bacterium]